MSVNNTSNKVYSLHSITTDMSLACLFIICVFIIIYYYDYYDLSHVSDMFCKEMVWYTPSITSSFLNYYLGYAGWPVALHCKKIVYILVLQ